MSAFVADAQAGKVDGVIFFNCNPCLLYTSDAADERSSVDLGGRRIIKKKTREGRVWSNMHRK